MKQKKLPFESFLSIQFSSVKFIHVIAQPISRKFFISRLEAFYALNKCHCPFPHPLCLSQTSSGCFNWNPWLLLCVMGCQWHWGTHRNSLWVIFVQTLAWAKALFACNFLPLQPPVPAGDTYINKVFLGSWHFSLCLPPSSLKHAFSQALTLALKISRSQDPYPWLAGLKKFRNTFFFIASVFWDVTEKSRFSRAFSLDVVSPWKARYLLQS